MASPVFKTGVTRLRQVWWVRFPHSPATAVFFFAVILAGSFSTPCTAAAQRTDSTRAGVAPQIRAVAKDTTSAFRISPGRAFLTSLLVPGLGQVKLDRPKAATIFAVIETGAIGMSLKSWNDLKKSKDARADTVGTPAVDAQNNPVIDPKTGLQVINYAPRNPNIADRVRARRTHLEDWIAAIVFNHLFSGADSYVAANLQDFNTNVEANAGSDGVRVMARVAW